jgi:hypothetical protein
VLTWRDDPGCAGRGLAVRGRSTAPGAAALAHV